ncbi:MAG TPA: universal stress protein [Longimicrobiales bacterium]|nr:universal stress protein [Longimicrobiales bacterium]
MLRRIAVPLDGNPFAEAALPLALAYAARDRARVTLVTVWRPLPPPQAKSSWEEERRVWQDEDRARLEQALHDLAATASTAAGVTADVEVIEGGVDRTLPQWAASTDLDLTVMATHARPPIVRAWLGSAADRMVREGRHPVLLVHPESEEPDVQVGPATLPRRVLVALDGSRLAERALDESVLGGAAASEVELVLVRVVPRAAGVPGYVSQADVMNEETLESLVEEAERHLAEVAGRAGWARSVETEVVVSDPVAKAITDVAAARRVDLIAMGTHGRGGFERAVLGSVADKVMRTAKVPVLLFPGRGEGE